MPQNTAKGNNNSLNLLNIKAPKNGYAYIYISNESIEPVYFDNFKASHTRGRIIEENHYYAFGLRIAGISAKKLGDGKEGYLSNKNLYNDKELFEEADLNWYDCSLFLTTVTDVQFPCLFFCSEFFSGI